MTTTTAISTVAAPTTSSIPSSASNPLTLKAGTYSQSQLDYYYSHVNVTPKAGSGLPTDFKLKAGTYSQTQLDYYFSKATVSSKTTATASTSPAPKPAATTATTTTKPTTAPVASTTTTKPTATTPTAPAKTGDSISLSAGANPLTLKPGTYSQSQLDYYYSHVNVTPKAGSGFTSDTKLKAGTYSQTQLDYYYSKVNVSPKTTPTVPTSTISTSVSAGAQASVAVHA